MPSAMASVAQLAEYRPRFARSRVQTPRRMVQSCIFRHKSRLGLKIVIFRHSKFLFIKLIRERRLFCRSWLIERLQYVFALIRFWDFASWFLVVKNRRLVSLFQQAFFNPGLMKNVSCNRREFNTLLEMPNTPADQVKTSCSIFIYCTFCLQKSLLTL